MAGDDFGQLMSLTQPSDMNGIQQRTAGKRCAAFATAKILSPKSSCLATEPPPRSFIWPLISLNAFFYRSMDGNSVVTGPSLLEAGDSEYVALTSLSIKAKVNLSLISISARSRPGKSLTGFVSIK